MSSNGQFSTRPTLLEKEADTVQPVHHPLSGCDMSGLDGGGVLGVVWCGMCVCCRLGCAERWQAGCILAKAERVILTRERSPTSPILLVSQKCPRVTRSSLGCGLQSGNMDDEETTFLGLAYQEMMNGGIQLNRTKEALAATTAGFVSGDQCERRLGVDDRRRGIEALCLRQSIPSSQCTTQGVSLSSHAADRLTKSSPSAQRVLMDFFTRGYWRLVHDPTFESAKKRQDAGKKDILHDGVIRGDAKVRYESASGSGDVERVRRGGRASFSCE